MKKNIFLIVITMIVISFVLVQCTKENTSEPKNKIEDNQSIELRSSISIGGKVLSPKCDISSDLPAIQCAPEDTVTKILVAQNGCNVKVTMHVRFCADFANNNINIEFSDLQWSLAPPFSMGCMSWWSSLMLAQPGQQNQMLAEFEDYIEQEFEDQYMNDYVVANNISCESPFRYVSAYYYKSPCTQRCSTPPGPIDDPYFTYTTPCADDGCCGNYTYYCLDKEGNVIKEGPNTTQIVACSLWHPVTCSKGTVSIGDCVDNGCE